MLACVAFIESLCLILFTNRCFYNDTLEEFGSHYANQTFIVYCTRGYTLT